MNQIVPFQDDWRASCGETRRLLLGKLRDTLVQQGHPDPQVWTPNQFFFCFLSVKIIDLPARQINDPSSRKHYPLPFLTATISSLSRTLEGLLGLSRCPSRALKSPRALFPDLQRIKDTFRFATLGAMSRDSVYNS